MDNTNWSVLEERAKNMSNALVNNFLSGISRGLTFSIPMDSDAENAIVEKGLAYSIKLLNEVAALSAAYEDNSNGYIQNKYGRVCHTFTVSEGFFSGMRITGTSIAVADREHTLYLLDNSEYGPTLTVHIDDRYSGSTSTISIIKDHVHLLPSPIPELNLRNDTRNPLSVPPPDEKQLFRGQYVQSVETKLWVPQYISQIKFIENLPFNSPVHDHYNQYTVDIDVNGMKSVTGMRVVEIPNDMKLFRRKAPVSILSSFTGGKPKSFSPNDLRRIRELCYESIEHAINQNVERHSKSH